MTCIRLSPLRRYHNFDSEVKPVVLPQAILDFLAENAASNGAGQPGHGDDLFKSGALDSFSLVDLVAVLEEHCRISVPDADVTPANFRTIEAITTYVDTHGT